MRGLDNLIVLGGEATFTLANCIKSNRLSEIFVNYPDPPVWERSQWLLIADKFLREAHRTLIPSHSITIITDDKNYS